MSNDKFIIPALVASNYSAWATQMEHVLCFQGVWDVVSGDEKAPTMDHPKYASASIQSNVQTSTDAQPVLVILEPEQQAEFDEDCKVYKTKSQGPTLQSFPTCRSPSLRSTKSTKSLLFSGKRFKNDMRLRLRSVELRQDATSPTRA
jgi:hypothetical protein